MQQGRLVDATMMFPEVLIASLPFWRLESVFQKRCDALYGFARAMHGYVRLQAVSQASEMPALMLHALHVVFFFSFAFARCEEF